MARRVALARAILSRPRLLILDEPLSALDYNAKQELLPYIQTIHKEFSIPVIYVSHDIKEVLQLGDSIVLMENGKIVLDDSVEKLKENEDIKMFYLGLTEIGKKSYRDVKHYKRRKRWLS